MDANVIASNSLSHSLSTRRWRPAPRLYICLLIMALTAFALVFCNHFFAWGFSLELSGAILLAGFLLALIDYMLSRQLPPIKVTRDVAGNLAVDKWAKVTLRFSHSLTKTTQVYVFDGLPASVERENLPFTVTLIPGQSSRQEYSLKPLARGPLELSPCYLQVPSPFGFWQIHYRSGEPSAVKVYPDFMAIAAYTILATDNHTSQMGIKKKPRRGSGMEFQQLREYRLGDSMRQLDWKATARRQKLISREYQDERDQQIVLLVDSGRRMRAKDDDLSHFDHSLNAMLLVGYIALRQGDSVSVLSFGETNRWIPPQKGADRVKNLLNGMYDLQAGQCAPDYSAAAEKLSMLQQKRSLVILVTNSRDEDVSELLLAVNLLKRRHLVMIANIREAVLDQLNDKPVSQLDDALGYTGVQHYLSSRRDVQRKMAAAGVYTLDCTAKELAMRVANSYLEIKSAGVL
jgi:uncharacterized protein (DUF58 family)